MGVYIGRDSCFAFDYRKSRDSSVGIAVGYGLDDRGSRVRFPAGAGNFCLHHRVQNGSGPHQWVPGCSFPGVKRPGREADHSPPSSAEVKECVELYLHSQYAFMVWCLVKHRDSCTFSFDNRMIIKMMMAGSVELRTTLGTWSHIHKVLILLEVREWEGDRPKRNCTAPGWPRTQGLVHAFFED
jgi:hypothetical protein